MKDDLSYFWGLTAEDLMNILKTSSGGLTEDEAALRLVQNAPRKLQGKGRFRSISLFLSQFKSPIILILLFAAFLSFLLHDPTDALIICLIILVSGVLGFFQEQSAAKAVEQLLAIVKTRTKVLREGNEKDVPAEEVVPGDIITLSAGTKIPGDALMIESNTLFVDEAALTGETFPQEKPPGVLPKDTPLSRRSNVLFMGSHVVSGSGRAVVVRTGSDTELGKISGRLRLRPPQTEFERGVARFGYMLMEVTLILVVAIFAINVYLKRPVLESFLFSLALAVGLTPQLLPAIVSVNLAHGARRMAAAKVIVKRLFSIENLGSMNVLCSDKTGTLTEGVVRVQGYYNAAGQEDERVLFHAYLNAFYETGYQNPVDEAIRGFRPLDINGFVKLGEVPYDFIRKRISVFAAKGEDRYLITKGALRNILEICDSADLGQGNIGGLAEVRERIEDQYSTFSRQGLRVLGLALKRIEGEPAPLREQEAGMTFMGFLAFSDPPKEGIAETIKRLKDIGVSLKMVTGDNPLVAAAVGRLVGLSPENILTGPEVRKMGDDALRRQVGEVDIFAEVEPNQKERIILAFKKAGSVVGYLGDGINDATALHAADVGISVDSGVDVAKEAADIVLLDKDLDVVIDGVLEGRTTFANTLKYVFMASSANFGNMFSMAGASLFLPFLPLLPKQILLTNLLTDLPEMAIAGDRVDKEYVERPRRWDNRFIRRFMLTFGLLSSIFDYLTFGLLLLLGMSRNQFRAGWFVESVVSAVFIVLVVRTRRPFFKSKPAVSLIAATLLSACAAAYLPFSPLGGILGFQPPPLWIFTALCGIVLFYIFSAERVKGYFYFKNTLIFKPKNKDPFPDF
jgi:Mg2+-importing ATPase